MYPQLHELDLQGVHLQLGKEFLQVQDHEYSILMTAKKQLTTLLLA